MRIAAIMFLFALLLQGCGHKGPLFMPPEQPAVQPATQPAAAQAAPQQTPASQP